MSLPQDMSRSIARKVADHDLPHPVYAALGLIDLTRSTLGAVTGMPGALRDRAAREYSALVERGQVRSVELAAERVVRARVSQLEERIVPRATRTTVKWNDRRRRWTASPAARRATATRQRARAAAERFSRLNAPVMAAEEPSQEPRRG